jgi:ribonuclease HII
MARPPRAPTPAPVPWHPGDVEKEARQRGLRWLVGTDEAGRGPLAGPVVAAAVVLDLDRCEWCVGLDDSKRLRADQRDMWWDAVHRHAVAVAVATTEADEIDRINILQASLRAMRDAVERACEAAGCVPGDGRTDAVLVDGTVRIPGLAFPQRTLAKGDQRSWAIAAASVLAKVTRDRVCDDLALQYPGWGFERHRGYPTPAHLERLRALGPTAAHRRSFAPVRAVLGDAPHAGAAREAYPEEPLGSVVGRGESPGRADVEDSKRRRPRSVR